MEKFVNMKIHAHIIAYNEEKILPFTLDYYSTICEKIFIYDNMSNDGSDEIYKQYPKLTVLKWESQNTLNDLYNSQIKSRCYKEFSKDADWVIVCDCDEFLYHPNLIKKLKEYDELGISLPRVNGYEMFSEEFPIYDGTLITEKIKHGSDIVPTLCKQIIFKPNVDLTYSVGAHSNKCPDCVSNYIAELKLLHYKYLNLEYVVNRYKVLNDRLSDLNKTYGWGHHYNENNAVSFFNQLKKTNKILID